MNFRPRKSLGQNFLIDDNIVRKIINVFNPRNEDLIVEIGPGKGALTKKLSEYSVTICAVEIDRFLAEELKNYFSGQDNVSVVHGDFLEFDLIDLAEKWNRKVRVIGNIPYSITGAILFYLLECREYISDCTLMVQREVADRIFASPGSRSYGILSVLLGTFAEIRKDFRVPGTVFRPQPEVDSFVFSFQFRPVEKEILNEAFYIDLVKMAFQQRRKQLKNALKQRSRGIDLNDAPVDLGKRAEMLSIGQFIELANWIYRNSERIC